VSKAGNMWKSKRVHCSESVSVEQSSSFLAFQYLRAFLMESLNHCLWFSESLVSLSLLTLRLWAKSVVKDGKKKTKKHLSKCQLPVVSCQGTSFERICIASAKQRRSGLQALNKRENWRWSSRDQKILASAGVPAFESQRWRGRPILLLYSLIPWDILDHLGMAQLLQNSTQGNVLKTCVFFQHYVLDTQKLKHYLTWGDWSEIPAVFFVDRNESHIYTLLCVLPTGQPLAHGTTSHHCGGMDLTTQLWPSCH